jgi:hypothetical protein
MDVLHLLQMRERLGMQVVQVGGQTRQDRGLLGMDHFDLSGVNLDCHWFRTPVIVERWVATVALGTIGAHTRPLRTLRLPRHEPLRPTRGPRAPRGPPFARRLGWGCGAR